MLCLVFIQKDLNFGKHALTVFFCLSIRIIQHCVAYVPEVVILPFYSEKQKMGIYSKVGTIEIYNY